MTIKESVYLIGCRAVGKSSIGRKLAQALSCTFLDTDAMITESRGQSVAEIVAEGGWSQFREYEKDVLLRLPHMRPCVVATGGGAILHSDVWSHLKKEGRVVWLRAALDILCERIRGDHHSETLRPSLTGKDICRELEDILAERSVLYKAAADCIIDTGTMDVDEAVSQIKHYVQGME